MATKKAAGGSGGQPVSPAAQIEQLFEETDENGALVCGNGSAAPCTFHANWNRADRDEAKAEWEKWYRQIQELAAMGPALEGEQEAVDAALEGKAAAEAYDRFLYPLSIENTGSPKRKDLQALQLWVDYVRQTARQVDRGRMKEAASGLAGLYDLTGLPADSVFSERTKAAVAICTFEWMLQVWWLYRLLRIHAPAKEIRQAAAACAESMVISLYGVRADEMVANALHHRLSFLENRCEEEIDSAYRRTKNNSRKSLAPLFIYQLLMKHTDKNHHLTQQELLELLAGEPYEIQMERKALSRIVHALCAERLAVFSSPKEGVWYDETVW